MRDLLLRIWPKRLQHRAPALVAVVMLGGLLALHQIASFHLAGSVSESVRQRALAAGRSATERLTLGTVDAIRVWLPVGPAASHGTPALTFSQDGDLAMIERMQLDHCCPAWWRA